jgi:GT2 family glycosyltransferase
MDKDGLVGVVTVTFNSASVIKDFMDSLLKQTQAEFVLYIIDNASTDETLRLLAKYKDLRIVVVRNSTNVGVAEGNNIGIRAALKDGCMSVLLINNDTVFDSCLLSQLSEGLLRHASHMAVPKIFYFDEPDRIWCAGGFFSRIRGSARHFGVNRKDNGQFDQPRAVTYGPTCCMLIKKEVFERIGLMDANYFVYFDDTDFCYRAWQAGINLFYISSARLFHKVSSLAGSNSEFTIRYCIRNHVYYVLKNFPRWQCLFYLPALQIHVFAKFIFLRQTLTTFWVAEKAYWEGISLFHSRSHSREIT